MPPGACVGLLKRKRPRHSRGRLVRVQVQCLLAAAAQNIKKIAIATPPAKAKPA